MSNDKYLGIFIDESRENLQILSDKLMELEDDPENIDILNEIFRAAHTFKGMAKTMGFNNIADLTHKLENLLELLRSGQKKVNKKISQLLFQGLDKIETLVESITETGTETESPAVKELVEELEKIINDDKEAEVTDSSEKAENSQDNYFNESFNNYENLIINEALEKGFKPKEISVYIQNECAMPAVRCYMVNSTLESEGEIFKTLPCVEEIDNNQFLTSGEHKHLVKFYIISNTENDILKDKIMSVSEVEKVEIVNLNEIIAEKKAEKTEEESPKEKPAKTTKFSSQTIRVNADRLDNLINLVGELVINRTRIAQLASEIENKELSGVTSSLENISREIQEIVMKLRMVPIEQVFSRFPRLVRDITTEKDKDVNLIVKGQEIEVDRTIADEIAEPLVHLIRNALDHGIETKEERIKAGKKVKGTLQLTALNECENILIKVIDDGKGIDSEKIKKKAIEKGLVQKEEAEKLTQDDIYELIFKPGFSTMDKATDLSGRGVGMDVVKTKIQALNGTVNIKSEKGVGTTFTISLPSTMTIIKSLIIEVGNETYALPLNYINEVIDYPINQIKYLQNSEAINFRGKVIPIKRLGEMLDVPDYSRNNKDNLTIVLMQSEEKLVGISVSRIASQQEIVIKNISKDISAKDYISGVTTLGSGQVAFILNINTLIN